MCCCACSAVICERALFDQADKQHASAGSSAGVHPDSRTLAVNPVWEVAWNKRKDLGQVHQGAYDETCGEWVTLGCAKVRHNSNILSQTHVRLIIYHVCETREKCASVSRSVHSTRCSVFIIATFRNRHSRGTLQNAREGLPEPDKNYRWSCSLDPKDLMDKSISVASSLHFPFVSTLLYFNLFYLD